MPGLPLVVVVTYARSEVLAPWYRHLYTFGLLVAAIVVDHPVRHVVLVRQTNALAAKTRALARTNARFDAALSNMPHGLSMFDAKERLLVCNSRYREMYDLTEDRCSPELRSAASRGITRPREPISISTNSFGAPRTGRRTS